MANDDRHNLFLNKCEDGDANNIYAAKPLLIVLLTPRATPFVMITRLRFLQGIGQFENVSAGAQIPLARLALVFAENGRGKTTLTAIVRSLASGDPLPISERRRLGGQNAPHAVIDCTGNPQNAVFQNGAWSRTLNSVVVFDDHFAADNVCAGLAVGSQQRQNLHELIIGAQGVSLNRTFQALVARIEEHNRTLRARAQAIHSPDSTLTVDEFCALPQNPGIEAALLDAERAVAAVQALGPVQNTSAFEALEMPDFDIVAIERILGTDLPNLQAAVAAKVRSHLESIGPGGEEWIAQGIGRQYGAAGEVLCPFCAQATANSPIIAHYEAYFSRAYSDLRREIAEAAEAIERAHSGDSIASFERQVRVASERRTFWARFTEPAVIQIDTGIVALARQNARDALLSLLNRKSAAPLNRLTVDETTRTAIENYRHCRDEVITLSRSLVGSNPAITQIKTRAAAANLSALQQALNRIRAAQVRHSEPTAALCTAYLQEAAAKAQTESQRDAARAALDNYRTNVFPAYRDAVNGYLARFQAGFRLQNVSAATVRGGSTCTYEILINQTPVNVGANEPPAGNPSFRTTLSAGDRNSLALAFFFASIERDPNRAQLVVVIDDPVSSLDDHRTLTTVQHLRRLVAEVGQVVVLSHNKSFLCRIWEQADPAARCALQVMRDAVGSTLTPWDVNLDSTTEHDQRHERLREFLAGRIVGSPEVARAIRPTLEAFLRVAYPEFYTPGMLLGPFRGLCAQRVGSAQEILNQTHVQDLQDIVEYANRFHHDTNPAWETAGVNEAELQHFVGRALQFARR